MKIGILTHYYGSNNYGGVLQAYALVKVLRDMGYEAEQICFPLELNQLNGNCIKPQKSKKSFSPQNSAISKRRSLSSLAIQIKQSIYARTKGRRIERKNKKKYCTIETDYLSPRYCAFDLFRDEIPHSNVEYSINTLFMANATYDVFITGSDQVWNLTWHTPGFFLEFVDSDKKKIAYAASAGNSEFDAVQREYLTRVLTKFDAVSVREADLVETYRAIAGIEFEPVLDPVLLLDCDNWDEIASNRLIHEKYLFCFFYNPTEQVYVLTKSYAEQHGLKIAIIPYALGNKKMNIDDDFGDYRKGAASPRDFISLVKYADYVFTDSFHAAVYSLSYKKQVFVFGRHEETAMKSRIVTLTQLFDCEARFCNCDEQMTLAYLESQKPIDYSKEYVTLKKLKNKSLFFLKNAIEK